MPSPGDHALGWTTLAHLLRPQGRRGELLADLLTDFPERFQDRTEVFLAAPGYSGPSTGARPMTVLAHWLPVGRNLGRVVLHFAGIDSISAAEPLAGLDVLIPDSGRVTLAPGEHFIDDLTGCSLFDRGILVGTVTGVDFPLSSDGARRIPGVAPLLTVETPNGEALIPYVQSFLLTLDVPGRRIDMALPQGLLELNQP